MTQARILICHRTRLFGELLQRELQLEFQSRCLWQDATTILAGADADDDCLYDLLLLDGDLPRTAQAAALSKIRQRSPQCRLVLVVSDAAVGRLGELAELGSQGCVAENSSFTQLCAAIRSVLAGQCYYAEDLANALMAQLNGNAGARFRDGTGAHEYLTPREREILQMIASENLSNKQIARRLNVSLYTVKNHVHNVIEKLAATDRHGAVRSAQRRHLIWTA